MTKKITLTILLIFSLLSMSVVVAQEPTAEPAERSAEDFTIPPKAIIKAKDFVEVNKRIIFDASESFAVAVKGQNVSYSWDFGDGKTGKGVEVVHTYDTAGEYAVKLTVKNADGESVSEHNVLAYKRLVLMITDRSSDKNVVNSLADYAKKQGVFLKLIETFDIGTEFVSEDALIQKIAQSSEELKAASQILIWTKSGAGLKMISRLPVELKDAEIDYNNKDIIFVTSEGINTITRIARGTFKLITPDKIIITNDQALFPLIDQESTDLFLVRLTQRAVPFSIIDKDTEPLSVINFMSYLINYLVQKNIPINTIILILMLPVIVTVISFLKQVIGLSTLGVYTPSIITLSFLALDFKFGMIFLLAILAVGTVIRTILKRYRLLYIPRVGIILTMVSLTILLILAFGAYFNFTKIVSASVFPLLIMSTLAEKFVSIQGTKGIRAALYVVFETVLVAIIAYLVIGGEMDLYFFSIQWEFLRTLMFGYPELIFVFLLINIFLGRWTGLRLSEYIRFKEVLRLAEEE